MWGGIGELKCITILIGGNVLKLLPTLCITELNTSYLPYLIISNRSISRYKLVLSFYKVNILLTFLSLLCGVVFSLRKYYYILVQLIVIIVGRK